LVFAVNIYVEKLTWSSWQSLQKLCSYLSVWNKTNTNQQNNISLST